MVAGGRLGAAGETTTGHGAQRGLHPGGMPEPCVRELSQPFSKCNQRQADQSSGTHSGCRVGSASAQWSAPFPLADHRLPSANPPGCSCWVFGFSHLSAFSL